MYSVIGFKRPTSLFPMKLFSDWRILLSFAVTLVTAALTVYLIYLTRNFIKNLLEDKIFDQSNTRLANQAWKVFLALTFLSILTATGNLLQPPFSLDASMSAIPLLGALIIWILMKILEKGMEIAQENEFTI